MKKILFLLILVSSTMTFAQQTTVKTAFLEKWENSKNYLVAMAEAMPEEHYDYKPTERQRSFQEQIMHIKDNMDWLSTSYFTETEFKREKHNTAATKAETIAAISASFDAAAAIINKASEETFSETVDFFAGPKSKLQILNLMQDHVTHHRGQIIVYLNLKDVEPPRFVGW